MIRITEIDHIREYQLRLKFNDDAEGVVDIAKQIEFKGVFEPLKDIEFFKQVQINEDWGTIEWQGEIDLDPEVLYEEVTGKRVEWAVNGEKQFQN